MNDGQKHSSKTNDVQTVIHEMGPAILPWKAEIECTLFLFIGHSVTPRMWKLGSPKVLGIE